MIISIKQFNLKISKIYWNTVAFNNNKYDFIGINKKKD